MYIQISYLTTTFLVFLTINAGMSTIFSLKVPTWRFLSVFFANLMLALLLMYLSLTFLPKIHHLDTAFLIACLSYIITAHISFQENLISKLMLISAAYLCEGIIALSLRLILPSGYGFLASVLTQVIVAALIIISLNYKTAVRRILFTIPQKTFMPLVTYALISLILLQIHRQRIIALELRFAYFIILLALILFIFMIIALYQTAVSTIAQNEKNIISTLEEAERRSYKLLLSSIESLRIKNHDSRHHIRTVKGFLQYGKKDEALKYLDILEKDNANTILSIACLNPALDAVLKYYIGVFKENNIDFEHHFTISETLGEISDIDLCSALSNLLENAQTATLKLEEENRKIRAIAFERQNTLIIKVENSSLPQKHPFKHGTGIISLTHLTTKHNGTLTLTPQNTTFTATLALTLT